MEKFIGRRETLWATVGLGVVAWIFQCSLTIADPDLWGHTLYGMRAIEQGVLLESVDPFSYSAPNAPWHNHEWATEYEFGWLWMTFGNPGLLAWKYTVLGLLMTWLTWHLCRSEANLGTRLMLITFTTLCLGNFVVYIRPQLITFLFFPVFLTILNWLWEKWTPLGWTLPLLMILWVNHHGGFLAGVALTGFYSFMAWIRVYWDPSQWKSAMGFSGVCIMCVAATLVNPYGIDLHGMLWTHLGTKQDVREWQSVWEVGFSWVYTVPFLILIYAFSCTRRWRWIDLLTMLVIAFQAVSHLRHIALLCLAEIIFLPPILSAAIQNTFPRLCQQWGAPESWRLRWTGLFTTVLFLVLIQFRGAIPLWKSGVAPWDIAVETTSGVPGMPTQAIRFLNDNDLSGNVLTDYGWAQFVIWQTFPESRIGFDGRYRTVYNSELEEDFLAFQVSGVEQPETTPFLDDQPTQIVLTPSQSSPARYLSGRSDWEEIYSDGQARIFVKDGFVPEKQIADLQIQLPKRERLAWEIFPTDRITGTEIATD